MALKMYSHTERPFGMNPELPTPQHLLQEHEFLLALTDLAQSRKREYGGRGEVKDRWRGRMKGVPEAQFSPTWSYLTSFEMKSTKN